MNKTLQDRIKRLMPDGVPKYIRCYDSGSFDRFTVVYTKAGDGRCYYVGMSSNPYHPQGFGQHGEHDTMIDRPKYSHLGKKITFQDLPEDCQKLVISDYKMSWGLNE